MDSTVSKRRQSFLCLVTMLALAWPALADDVKVMNTPIYSNSQVTGLDGLSLVFNFSGNKITKELSDVELILLDGQESFNRAEKEYADGKYTEAIASYSTALDRANADWIKKLITLRRLRMLSRNGPVDQAARDWVAVVSANGPAPYLAPQKFGAKGSNINAAAIRTLEAAADKEKQKAVELAAIQQVLLKLYEVEGQKDKIEKLKSAGVTAEDTSSLTSADAVATLRDANNLVASKPEDVLTMVRSRINAFPASDLPKALMITARAQQAMASKLTGEDRKGERNKLLAAAGLDFMRVFIFFPSNNDAAEALLQAGHCCRDIGNTTAARTTYKLLREDFADTDQAKQALKALESL